MGYQLLTNYCEVEKKSSTWPLSKFLFTTFLLLLSNGSFWMTCCTEGPLFPFAFWTIVLNYRQKYATLMHLIQKSSVHYSDLEEGLSFRHDGWMGMSHAYFKMIRCMHSGKRPSKPVCIWKISSVKLEYHIIYVMYVRNKTQQGVLL